MGPAVARGLATHMHARVHCACMSDVRAGPEQEACAVDALSRALEVGRWESVICLVCNGLTVGPNGARSDRSKFV